MSVVIAMGLNYTMKYAVWCKSMYPPHNEALFVDWLLCQYLLVDPVPLLSFD